MFQFMIMFYVRIAQSYYKNLLPLIFSFFILIDYSAKDNFFYCIRKFIPFLLACTVIDGFALINY